MEKNNMLRSEIRDKKGINLNLLCIMCNKKIPSYRNTNMTCSKECNREKEKEYMKAYTKDRYQERKKDQQEYFRIYRRGLRQGIKLMEAKK